MKTEIYKLKVLLWFCLMVGPVFANAVEAQERMHPLVAGDTTFLLCDTATLRLANMGGTDCWGWSAPDGTDYVVMGTQTGLSFVSLATMSVVDQIAGPESSCGGSYWRDMVTYGHYLYCVSECSGTNQGFMVIDLQYLPDSAHLIRIMDINPFGDVWSHNMAVDTVKGYAYLEGNWWSGSSVQVFDLVNPELPVWVNQFGIGNGGIHDIYVMNDTAYVAEGSNGSFSIYNLANKTSPQLLARVTIPNPGYVHNIWPTDDRRHVVTTEETAFHTVKIWNIENLANIQLSGEYLAPNGLAHNVHVAGNSTLFISHYESGVAWVDISDPSNPRELAVYDTWADEDPDYLGCWGVFPHTQDGLVYASNKDGFLYILKPDTSMVADTLIGQNTAGQAGEQVSVLIYASSREWLRSLVIPIQWSGPLNMLIDSVSTSGLRTDYFEVKQYVAWDQTNKRIGYWMTSSLNGTSPDLAPGYGPVLRAHFTIPSGASGASNPVWFDSFGGTAASFGTYCYTSSPELLAGSVSLGDPSCCTGIRGNIDSDPAETVDIVDLTSLADFLFSGGGTPACMKEANVDGDPAESVDIVDLTYLVDYLFGGGAPPAACPIR